MPTDRRAGLRGLGPALGVVLPPLAAAAGRHVEQAEGPDDRLLGVRAVLAQSFERIHRSNLVGMGILPLQFIEGENADALRLTGAETFAITGVDEATRQPGGRVTVTADDRTFTATVRLDTPREIAYYRHGGIMRYVLRRIRMPTTTVG